MNADLEPIAVGDIAGSFYVPAYQRGYRWGDDEVNRLLDDIWASDGQPYYLQPVVVKPLEDGRWELIDGQQRFTTLYLIFQFMFLERLQNSGPGFKLEYETRSDSSEFLKAPSADQRDANIDYHHILGAFEQIRAWFEKFEHRTQWAANKLYDYLFESVKVIWYQAPDDVDSIELFTRLNVGRIPLTDAELVKALVLAESRNQPGVSDKSEQIAAQWDWFERELRIPEVWAFITGKSEDEPTHIGLILDTLADRIGGAPNSRHRPRYYTFETLRPVIKSDPQAFWDDVVSLHSLIVGWFEDRHMFHKVGFLVAVGASFPDLVEATAGLTKRGLHEALDSQIRDRLKLTRAEVSELTYDADGPRCSALLLLMNVETVRRRSDTSERYSFNAHARGAWSLEHIHAQNAKDMKRDEKIWAEWLRLHRAALTSLHDIDAEELTALKAEIDALLESINDSKTHGIGPRFDALRATVEEALSDGTAEDTDEVHSITNLALLGSGDNSALSNSTFEVKRREILDRDKTGAYIPACTRNVFLKYYTDSDAQQIHFWGAADRDAYLAALLSAVKPYLLPEEVSA